MLILSHGHLGRLGSAKNWKTPFFWRYWKFLPLGDSYRSRTSPVFFLFKISQQIRLLEASKVLAKMGLGWQAVWVIAKFFLSNLHNYMMNKSGKFHEDILILVWVRAYWVKNCCNQRTPNVRIKISLWKFSIFLSCVCKFDKKNFGHNSNSLPAMAHFGQNFGRL